MDLIDRQAAIDAIENTDWYHQNRNKDMVSGANDAEHQAWYKSDDIYNALENVPSAQPEPHWIPCSERLPDIHRNVLITNGYQTAEGELKDNGDWLQYRWTCKRKHGEIIAWMPLPEPWRGEEHETD